MHFGKGLTLEPYFTFDSNIEKILTQLENTEGKEISDNSDVTTLIDMIIKTGMKKRASDIHIEPMEETIRVRYRIDRPTYNSIKYEQ